MDNKLVRFSITNSEQGMEESSFTNILDEGEKSFALYYCKLDSELKSCLAYFSFLQPKYGVKKGKLVRLLMAEGLIQERPGEIMEDVTKRHIMKLVGMGMLLEEDFNNNYVNVHYLYHKLFSPEITKEDIFKNLESSTHKIRVCIHENGKNILSDLSNLPIQSLIMFPTEEKNSNGSLSVDCLRTLCFEMKLLRVLDLEGVKIEGLPNEVSNFVHLRYLGLTGTEVKELPESLGDLLNLQTLDISWSSNLKILPMGVLKLGQLRHIKMRDSIDHGAVRVPSGIAKLTNLHTFTGLYAGDSTASELSNLTQLKKLGVMCFAEDHASELLTSIMKMEGLQSLSLEVERSYPYYIKRDGLFERDLFPDLNSFLPPLHLRNLFLKGVLVEIPNWFVSLKNLTKLKLFFSYLPENPTSVLQFLPNLKHLTLWEAYNAKKIGKEFCIKGGFPNLEYLCIASYCLIEWTELEDGAFPSLKHLELRECFKLELLPEGLQYITTLQLLKLSAVHGDLVRRLSPNGGKENYKVKHIPRLYMIPSKRTHK